MAQTSLKLSKKGQVVICEARRLKGWSTLDKRWGMAAEHISESTLKRFLKGQPIKMQNFINLCNALGIKEWQELVDWEDNDSKRVTAHSPEVSLPQQEPPKAKASLVVSGIFDEDQRLEIETLVEHLKTLLGKANVTIKARNMTTD